MHTAATLGMCTEPLSCPATRPPPSLSPSVRLGPPAAVLLLPGEVSLDRDGCESVQISSPVVPEQRSGGRQPPGTCCLFTTTPSAYKTGKSQDVCVCACAYWGRGVGPGGQAGHGEERGVGG